MEGFFEGNSECINVKLLKSIVGFCLRHSKYQDEMQDEIDEIKEQINRIEDLLNI
jgi:hypothetical protein